MRKYDLYFYSEVSADGETYVVKSTKVPYGKVPNQKKGLKMSHINTRQPEDPLTENDRNAGMWRCKACAMPIWEGSGAAGVTVNGECPYCGEFQE